MTCNHCKMSVEKAALNLDFVNEASVDLDRKELRVSLNGSDGEIEAVKKAVREASIILQSPMMSLKICAE